MATKFAYAHFYATISSSQSVELDDYAERLSKLYREFDEAGYAVVQVVPISVGRSEPRTRRDGTYVGDATFSVTQGAVVIGELRDS